MKELLRSVMAEVSGDIASVSPAELSCSENGSNGGRPPANEAVYVSSTPPLTVSQSFKEGKGSSRRRASVRPSLDADEFINLLHGSDPVKVELNRLENEVRGANAVRSGVFRRIRMYFPSTSLSFSIWFCFIFGLILQIRIENWGNRKRRSRL